MIPKVTEWRHHIHQNPELSNREFQTAEYIAAHLKGLGLEVQTGVAKTGVVGILKGGKPGPVVGLRADIDARRSVKHFGLQSGHRGNRSIILVSFEIYDEDGPLQPFIGSACAAMQLLP